MLRKRRRRVKRKKIDSHKGKLDLFNKIGISFGIILGIVLLYFLVLVSSKPKSFPFITAKIQAYLSENFGDRVLMENSKVSFTRYGDFIITLDKIKISYQSEKEDKKQELILPQSEISFSLIDLLFQNFVPKKIKIIDPEISLKQPSNQVSVDKSEDNQEVFVSDDSAIFLAIITEIRNKKFPLKNLEIENAKLLIEKDNISSEILIKKSSLKIKLEENSIIISTINKFTINKAQEEINLNLECAVDQNNLVKCDVALKNFIANSISSIHPEFEKLKYVDGNFNAEAKIVFDHGNLNNFLCKIKADQGSFFLAELFSKRINFSDLSLQIEYDQALKILNFSEIKANFINQFPEDNKANKLVNANNLVSPFNMSLLISNLKEIDQKYDFNIKIGNIFGDQIDKFWPIFLDDNQIRNWVINHIKDGLIKDASAKFSLKKNNQETEFVNLDARLLFEGLSLQYDDYFPELRNLSGIANFTEKAMIVDIASGDFLKSKITDAEISIEDFDADEIILNILAKSFGNADDLLKHIDYKSSFANEIKRYFNGIATSELDLKIPLKDKIKLKDIYLHANSVIEKFKNDYLHGKIYVDARKNFNSNEFVNNLDLSSANITADFFDIKKAAGIKSDLSFILAIADSNEIKLQNILLSKEEEIEEKKKIKNVKALISGNALINVNSSTLKNLNLKNLGFGKNKYDFKYSYIENINHHKISISGKEINLASFLTEKAPDFLKSSENKNSQELEIQSKFDNVYLLNNKAINNLALLLNCKQNFCDNARLKTTYNKKNFARIYVTKNKKENNANVDGRITDIGYLSEAFGLSKILFGGDASFNLKHSAKNMLFGEVKIDGDFIIYDNETVKKLAKNNLFSQVKDTIFSSEKTIFSLVKIDFNLNKDQLLINSLIANNYKIGITAKGNVNLKNGTYEIKGMIVPGFIINNLFGIGKIPLIGGVISGLLTGGEGGGIFGIQYEYVKLSSKAEPTFTTNKISSFVPTTIKNLFD
jgi:hypothetical protein